MKTTIYVFCLALILLGVDRSFATGAVQGDTTNSVERFVNKGYELLAAGQYDPAIEEFKKALASGKSAAAYGGIARANFEKAKVKYERVIPWREVRRLYYEKEAEENFTKAMELEPENLAWQYELSELYMHKGSDFDLEAASKLLESIRLKEPGFRNAPLLLAQVYERLKQMGKAEEIYGSILDTGADTRVFLNRTLAAAARDSLEQAEKYFVQAIDHMDKSTERPMFELTAMLFGETEFEEWRQAEDRRTMLGEFWLSRDPTPRTPENERIREHFRRLIYAEKNYNSPASQNRFDERGKVYIKYGEPSYRYQSSGGVKTFRNESWTYDYEINGNKDGLVFDFANVAGYGFILVQDLRSAFIGSANFGELIAMYQDRADINYAYYGLIGYGSWSAQDFVTRLGDLAAKKNDAYRRAPADIYIAKEFPPDRIPMSVSQASFRGKDGSTHYEIAYAFPLESLKYRVVNDTRANSLNQELIVRKNANDELFSKLERVDFEFKKKQSLKNEWHVGQINLDLPVYPSAPVANLRLEDPVNKQMSLAYCKLSNRDFSGDSLMISDVKFSYDIQPSRQEDAFTRNGLRVSPVVSGAIKKDKPVQVYFEVYNLDPAPAGQTSYKIQYVVRKLGSGANDGFAFFDSTGEMILPPLEKNKNEYIALESNAGSRPEEEANYLTVDLKSLEEGDYEFLINVVDNVSGNHAVASRNMRIVR